MSLDIQRRAAEGQKVVLAGVLLNLILSTGKIAGGLLGRSNALVADGIESLLDLFSSLLIWVALKYAAKPPDQEHPYGHGKAEALASLIGSLVLAIAGALIAHNSIVSLMVDLNQRLGVTFIVATHNLNLLKVASRTFQLADGLLNTAPSV